jgi:hypothetical protein
LQEYNHYHSVYNDYEDNYWANVPDSWWQDTPQAEKERVYDERKRFIQDAIGMKNPEENAFIFDSFDEAKRASENLLSTLPNPEYGFSLCIFGIQGKIQGLYFQRDCLPKLKKVKNGEGQFDYDIVPTGEYRDNIVYCQGVPSETKHHWSALIENY